MDVQLAWDCCLSDYCPIVLIVDEDNWSPKLLRMLKSWDDFFGYKESDAGS